MRSCRAPWQAPAVSFNHLADAQQEGIRNRQPDRLFGHHIDRCGRATFAAAPRPASAMQYQGTSMPLRLSTSNAASERRKLTNARAVAASFALATMPAEYGICFCR